MSDDWPVVALGDVTRQVKEAVVVEPGVEYSLLGLRMYGGGITARNRTTSKAAVLYRVRAGQFIYSRLWSRAGAFGVVPEAFDGWFASNEFPTFACDETRLSATFLWLYFQQPWTWDEVARDNTGSIATRTRWKEGEFARYRIPLPPLSVQHRIIEVICTVDRQITALDAETAALERVLRRTVHDLLAPRPGWEESTLGAVSRIVTGRTFKAEHQGRESGVVPYFRVSDMSRPGNERELLEPADWLDEDGVAAIKPIVCPPGTVVFPILGAALATEKRRVLGVSAGFVQHMIGLVPGPRIRSGFLLNIMSQVRLADLTQHGAMPSVNKSLVSKIRLWLPDLEAQAEIEETISSATQAMDDIRIEADRLRAARAALLAALLNREIEITQAERTVA